ncbi:hypothetical protein HAX54_033490 [Datura stramonium]|uniref:Uncharacterized protein n=1 Tax=Datura stramonium TaxID=4076 RepID=A0ABS8VE15_DATST|nr:hypothetical protein [Datura stramonium]
MEDSVPGESSFIISLRKSSVWPSVKPFVNGGLAAVLPATSSYFMLSSTTDSISPLNHLPNFFPEECSIYISILVMVEETG